MNGVNTMLTPSELLHYKRCAVALTPFALDAPNKKRKRVSLVVPNVKTKRIKRGETDVVETSVKPKRPYTKKKIWHCSFNEVLNDGFRVTRYCACVILDNKEPRVSVKMVTEELVETENNYLHEEHCNDTVAKEHCNDSVTKEHCNDSVTKEHCNVSIVKEVNDSRGKNSSVYENQDVIGLDFDAIRNIVVGDLTNGPPENVQVLRQSASSRSGTPTLTITLKSILKTPDMPGSERKNVRFKQSASVLLGNNDTVDCDIVDSKEKVASSSKTKALKKANKDIATKKMKKANKNVLIKKKAVKKLKMAKVNKTEKVNVLIPRRKPRKNEANKETEPLLKTNEGLENVLADSKFVNRSEGEIPFGDGDRSEGEVFGSGSNSQVECPKNVESISEAGDSPESKSSSETEGPPEATSSPETETPSVTENPSKIERSPEASISSDDESFEAGCPDEIRNPFEKGSYSDTDDHPEYQSVPEVDNRAHSEYISQEMEEFESSNEESDSNSVFDFQTLISELKDVVLPSSLWSAHVSLVKRGETLMQQLCFTRVLQPFAGSRPVEIDRSIQFVNSLDYTIYFNGQEVSLLAHPVVQCKRDAQTLLKLVDEIDSACEMLTFKT